MEIRKKLDFLLKLSRLFDRREKKNLVFIGAVILLMSIFQAAGVASIFPFISIIMEPGVIHESGYLSRVYHFLGYESERSFIIFCGAVLAGIIVAGNAVTAYAILLKSRFVWMKCHSLSSRVFAKYLSFPYVYFLNANTSTLEKNVLTEVEQLTSSFILPALEITTNAALIILLMGALVMISPAAAVMILILFSGFYGFVYRFGFRGKLQSRGERRYDEATERFKAVSEAMGGIKDIKILGREKYFLKKFKEHSCLLNRLQAWHEASQQMPRYLIEMLAFGGVVGFIIFLLSAGQDLKRIIPMASFFVFAGYRLMPEINRMFMFITRLQFNSAILERIHADLSVKSRGIGARGESARMIFKKEIRFKNLSFSYPGSDSPVFSGLSMSVPKNSSAAIVGPTGAGKTTLVDILLGLLPPSGGEITVDGARIDEDNLRSWQNIIGYVPQHIYLSDDSVRRNIAFGVPDELIDESMVRKAAETANLKDFIEKDLPGQYGALVGERGIRLSGGQRQRIGIARALYHDPEVLVFDEATSSLDGVTENVVLKAIEGISKMKTVIIIAHRLTTVKKCDRVYLVDRGRIAADGTYSELMENNALFRAMSSQYEKS